MMTSACNSLRSFRISMGERGKCDAAAGAARAGYFAAEEAATAVSRRDAEERRERLRSPPVPHGRLGEAITRDYHKYQRLFPPVRLEIVMPRLSFVILLALAAGPLAAQDGPPPPTPTANDTVPVVLTISGGISLGSYESGVNWALVDFFRHSYHSAAFDSAYGVRPHRLDVAAGASAGNINALLSSLEWCAGYDRRPPEQSLFWLLWTGMGIAELFPNDRAQRQVPNGTPGRASYGIFRRDSLEAFYRRTIVQRLGAPGSSDCSVSLGITLTKLQVDSIELNPRIYPRAQRFA